MKPKSPQSNTVIDQSLDVKTKSKDLVKLFCSFHKLKRHLLFHPQSEGLWVIPIQCHQNFFFSFKNLKRQLFIIQQSGGLFGNSIQCYHPGYHFHFGSELIMHKIFQIKSSLHVDIHFCIERNLTCLETKEVILHRYKVDKCRTVLKKKEEKKKEIQGKIKTCTENVQSISIVYTHTAYLYSMTGTVKSVKKSLTSNCRCLSS